MGGSIVADHLFYIEFTFIGRSVHGNKTCSQISALVSIPLYTQLQPKAGVFWSWLSYGYLLKMVTVTAV